MTSAARISSGSFESEATNDDAGPLLRLFAAYAYQDSSSLATTWRFGQGLVGQAALEGKRIVMTKVPHEYVRITSALGEAAPHSIVVAGGSAIPRKGRACPARKPDDHRDR